MLRAGDRLRSRIDTTELLVVRAPATDVTIRCGGQPMDVQQIELVTDSADAHSERGNFGRRYRAADADLEVLVIGGGHADLSTEAGVMAPVDVEAGCV